MMQQQQRQQQHHSWMIGASAAGCLLGLTGCRSWQHSMFFWWVWEVWAALQVSVLLPFLTLE
jgi:hypothetical protein